MTEQNVRNPHKGLLLMLVSLALSVVSHMLPVTNTQQSFVFLFVFTVAVLVGAKGIGITKRRGHA